MWLAHLPCPSLSCNLSRFLLIILGKFAGSRSIKFILEVTPSNAVPFYSFYVTFVTVICLHVCPS